MNVIYVEFSWRTEIRYARQVVMERLAVVPMPEGIRPQMTPPASIMGQILHVGLHHRNGAAEVASSRRSANYGTRGRARRVAGQTGAHGLESPRAEQL